MKKNLSSNIRHRGRKAFLTAFAKNGVPSPFAHIVHLRKRKFLIAFSLTGKINESEKLSRIHHYSHYCWLQNDVDYKKAFEIATLIAANRMEDEIRRRGFEGVNKPLHYKGLKTGHSIKEFSDNLAMFTVKKLIPEYRDANNSQSVTINADKMFLEIHARASREIDITPGKVEGPKEKQVSQKSEHE